MNPVAAVDAVSREPLATLQALAERLSQGPDGHDAQLPPSSTAMPGLAAALAESAALPPALASALDAAQAAAAATAQAQQGRMTLGQMAQHSQVSQAQLQSPALPTPVADVGSGLAQMALVSPQLLSSAGATAPAAAAMLAVPVLVMPLQSQASPHTQRNPAVQPEPTRQRGQRHSEDAPADDAFEQDSAFEAPEDPGGEPAEDEGFDEVDAGDGRALLALLRLHGSSEVQRELQVGRRVLVVLPQALAGRGLVAAQATLLGPNGARHFAHARWWASDRPAPAEGAAWPQWRVFREGDPLRAPLLVSRAEGQACRVLLGPTSPRWVDRHCALLEVPERLRFVQALGGQWSLVLVLAPPGVLK